MFRGGAKDGTKKSNAVAKYADTVGNKRAPNYERQEAVAALAELGTVEAAEPLLKRFTFQTDPSITDQEEKDTAFQGIVRAGRGVIPVVRTFAQKAESLSWPMRIVKALVSDEEFVDEILTWLARWDIEYSKFVDPKIQLLTELGDHENPKIRGAVERFLEDVTDDARYAATVAVLRQRDAASVPALMKMFPREESMRVKNKIFDGMAQNAWKVPAENIDTVRRIVPNGYSVSDDGTVTKFG